MVRLIDRQTMIATRTHVLVGSLQCDSTGNIEGGILEEGKLTGRNKDCVWRE